MKEIVSRSLSTNNNGHSVEDITQKRIKFTQHDCYKSVTQHIHKRCFDLQVTKRTLSFPENNSFLFRMNLFLINFGQLLIYVKLIYMILQLNMLLIKHVLFDFTLIINSLSIKTKKSRLFIFSSNIL